MSEPREAAADGFTEATKSLASDPESSGHSTTRRGTLVQLLTAVLSFLLVAIPSAIGGLFFLDPLLRRRSGGASGSNSAAGSKKDAEGFIRLDVSSNVIPADGTPVAVTVRDDMDDAWNRFVDVPVGSIWLRKNPDGKIVAFNSVCPHLGCSVNYRRSENDFFCPCHTSAFALDGTKTNDIPPRDMDSLMVATRTDGQDDPDGSEIWVRFQNFRRATAEKLPL